MSMHWDALTPDQLNELGYFYVYKSTAYALLGWFAWEYILTLGFEIDVFKRKRPLGLHLLPYFVTRYGCLATLIPNIMLIHSRSKIDCQAAVLVLVVMAATCQIFSQVMFSLRALALWNYNRIVATCLFVIWIPHAALSYMAVIGIQTSWAREPLGGTGFCAVLRYSQFAVPSYALLLAVDIIVGIFILVRLFSLRKTTRSTFTDILARDLLLYLLCCVITCIAGIVVVLAGNPSVALRSMFYVVTTQVHAVLSCRAYVNTSRLADGLPAHLQLRVHNDHLDPDTLRRIAGHLGMQAADPSTCDRIESPPPEGDMEHKEQSRQNPWNTLIDRLYRFTSWKRGRSDTIESQKSSSPFQSSFDKPHQSRADRRRGPSTGISPVSVETFSSTPRPFGDSNQKGGPTYSPTTSVHSDRLKGQSYFPSAGSSPSVAGQTESRRESVLSFAGTPMAYTTCGAVERRPDSGRSELLVVIPQSHSSEIGSGLTTYSLASMPSSPSDSVILRHVDQHEQASRASELRPPFRGTGTRWSYGRCGSNSSRGGMWDSSNEGGSGPDAAVRRTSSTHDGRPSSQLERNNSSATVSYGSHHNSTSPPPPPSSSSRPLSSSASSPSLAPLPPILRVKTTVVKTEVREDIDDDYPSVLSAPPSQVRSEREQRRS